MSELFSPLANKCRTLANEWQRLAAQTGQYQYAECAASLYALLVSVGKANGLGQVCECNGEPHSSGCPLAAKE